MKKTEMAIRILGATNDGNALSPGHLYLVELACNDNLNETGEEAFADLYKQVTEGTYVKPWFHGFEGLTKDHSGYVHWKGVCIEHFSYHDSDAERTAAENLAARCKALEEKGFPVNGRTATDSTLFPQAPADTPWLQCMLNYYTAFANSDGKATWLILNLPEHNGVAVSIVRGEIVTQYGVYNNVDSGVYHLFHALQAEGFRSCGNRLHSYAGFVSVMEEAGITPKAVERVLAAGLPECLRVQAA